MVSKEHLVSMARLVKTVKMELLVSMVHLEKMVSMVPPVPLVSLVDLGLLGHPVKTDSMEHQDYLVPKETTEHPDVLESPDVPELQEHRALPQDQLVLPDDLVRMVPLVPLDLKELMDFLERPD